MGDAQIIINISSSPYYASKVASRERMLMTRARDNSVNIVFCNMVGGQDELVFDGHSVVIGESGEIIARAKSFEEDLLIADINVNRVFRSRIHDPRRRKERHTLVAHSEKAEVIVIELKKSKAITKPPVKCRLEEFNKKEEEVFRALVMGTKDYITKNGFKKVAIGLSGGMGAGKSTVSGFFTEWGCRIVDADSLARQAVLPDGNALPELANHFGSDILDAEGNLNRTKMAGIAFTNPEALDL